MPRTVRDYFEAALRRHRGNPPIGTPVRGANGNTAAFAVSIANGRIECADYRCTTCVTLVALCEHLREMLPGHPAADAISLPPELLLAWHPEIPSSHRDRAELAVQALRAALTRTAQQLLL